MLVIRDHNDAPVHLPDTIRNTDAAKRFVQDLQRTLAQMRSSDWGNQTEFCCRLVDLVAKAGRNINATFVYVQMLSLYLQERL